MGHAAKAGRGVYLQYEKRDEWWWVSLDVYGNVMGVSAKAMATRMSRRKAEALSTRIQTKWTFDGIQRIQIVGG